MKEITELVLSKSGVKYKISRDRYQFILERQGKNKDTWESYGYYSSLKAVFKKLVTVSYLLTPESANLLDRMDKTCTSLEQEVQKVLKLVVKEGR